MSISSSGVRHVMQAAVPPMGMTGTLVLPEEASGIVILARSCPSGGAPSGLDAASPLFDNGLAALYFDLLTVSESQHTANVFNIPLLADRLDFALQFVRTLEETAGLPVCLLGADTAASAALVSAASMPPLVRTVVSCGGRPDLAGSMLAHLRSPSLLIVDGDDPRAISLNCAAMEKMSCETGIAVVSRAAQLFDDPVAMRDIARLTANWFAGFPTSQGAPSLKAQAFSPGLSASAREYSIHRQSA